jgi:aryl-alcohol dehydrogenase-like predicted oxidoreductase
MAADPSQRVGSHFSHSVMDDCRESFPMSFDKNSDLSRRCAIKGGLLAAMGAALPSSLLAADNKSLPIIQKAIPSTGQKLPAIGIGTNEFASVAYGGNSRGGTAYTTVRDVLKRMYELGGTVIDAASAYGDSEVQIGKALEESGLAQKMFVATKFDAPGLGAVKDGVYGQASIERSFERLHKVDLMFVHLLAGAEAMMPVLLDLKKQGRVRYIGLTNVFRNQDHPLLAGFMRKYPLDFVQVPYAIEDRAVEQEILPLAKQRKIAVMGVVPFSSNRGNLVVKAGKKPLPKWAADLNISSWGQFLLKYAISHPTITCVASGTTNIDHVVDNQAAARGPIPDAATRRRMEEYWASIV